jgi:hypothetical protein
MKKTEGRKFRATVPLKKGRSRIVFTPGAGSEAIKMMRLRITALNLKEQCHGIIDHLFFH